MSLRTMSHIRPRVGCRLSITSAGRGRPQPLEEVAVKPIVLHPGSVVAGVILAVVALAAAGASARRVQAVLRPPPLVIEHHIVGIPDPRDMLTIKEEDGP